MNGEQIQPAGTTNLLRNVACPSCSNEDGLFTFYNVKNIPLFQNIVYTSYEEAVNCKKADLELTCCPKCSMVFNALFNIDLIDYSEDYDNEQSISNYFLDYLDSLIGILQDDWELRNKKILEIGCGKGAFLKRICEKTNSEGFGFDSTYDGNIKSDNVTFKSYYFEKQDTPRRVDFIILRHVLEHIDQPFNLLEEILGNIDGSQKPKIIIEVPDFDWIIRNKAFWDIYYEHCNYFTKCSLQNLVGSLGLKIDAVFNTFNDQYIVLIATIGSHKTSSVKEKSSQSKDLLDAFSSDISLKKQDIVDTINRSPSDEYFVVWGGASKGVIFLAALDDETRKKIKFVVDVNKNKQGKYTAISGKLIKNPEALKKENSVKDIIIMNPNYEEEILEILRKMNKKFIIHRI